MVPSYELNEIKCYRFEKGENLQRLDLKLNLAKAVRFVLCDDTELVEQ